MVLFIGYPINYETVCNLFRLPTDTEDLKSTIEKAGFVFQHTDKGQYILGLEVKEVPSNTDIKYPVLNIW